MSAERSDHAENYEPFFGLGEAPFSLAPNPRFRFASRSHSAALAEVAAAIERREPLVVVLGEIGTGKTLLCRTVLQQLPRKTFLSVVDDPLLDRDDLLKQLLQDFGVISKDRSRLVATTRHELVDALQLFLRSLAPIGAHAVVIVDEAQHLQPEVLEQIRLLSNIDDASKTLLQVMLVGQAGLEMLLDRPELRQIRQRISRQVRLEALTGDEVRHYIEHRLALARGVPSSPTPGAPELARELAAWSGPNPSVAFTPAAIDAVAQRSGGLPRVINLLCDRALAAAFHAQVRMIDVPIIDIAARGLGLTEPPALAGAQAFSDAPGGAPPAVDEVSWNEGPIESAAPPFQPRDEETTPERGSAARVGSAASPRPARYAAIAAAVAAGAAAIWFGVHAARQPTTLTPPSAAGTSTIPAPAARPETTPPPVSEARPQTSTPAAATASSSTAASTPSTAASPATEARFDIVVASFRTDARAATVAAAVAALNLPMRRRVSDGWQQVVVGPFASRAAAETAQLQLDRAGLTGAQIVPTAQ